MIIYAYGVQYQNKSEVLNMAKEVTRVTFNLPKGLVDDVDAYGESMNINRTSAVSVLLSQALKAQKSMDDIGELVRLAKLENAKTDA